MNNLKYIVLSILCVSALTVNAEKFPNVFFPGDYLLGAFGIQPPSQLKTNLMSDTQTVYSYGYPTTATLEQVQEAWKRGNYGLFQVALVRTPNIRFGWQLAHDIPRQSLYRILVATKPELLREGKADVWDSKDVKSSVTNGIVWNGTTLKPETIYYWTVKAGDSKGNISPYAKPQAFLTAHNLDGEFERLPLRKTNQKPSAVRKRNDGSLFADFGKDAFAQLSLTIRSDQEDTLIIHLGEDSVNGGVNRNPGASVRYAKYILPVHKGIDTYKLILRPDKRNARIKKEGQAVRPVLMPDYIGEVFPFRYCQIEGKGTEVVDIKRHVVHYSWDENTSFFHSSDSTLNEIWNFCKYSIFATTYAGVYVDGDRERIPYEGDAIINQLSHYSVDQEYTMARYSVDYLCHNATWPTEWILQAPLLAWTDYLYTGDKALLQKDYEILKARTLIGLKESNGLVSTRTGKQTTELLRSCGYYGGRINDIVDWPRSGALGVGKDQPGEADGYQLKEYNTVVNSFHYKALMCLYRIAEALGKNDEAMGFKKSADEVKNAINRHMLDTDCGFYRDGIGSDHYSLHASMFPMAFGIVPGRYKEKVLRHIQSRGMACSVYGAQFLLDALYDGGLQDYALQLMTSKGIRSWWNMMKKGATITAEAWDRQFKPNLTWNHAWGAAPANIISRKLMGIEPLEPGWKRMRIRPNWGRLEQAEIRVPTLLGAVEMTYKKQEYGYRVSLDIPSGTVAEINLPCTKNRYILMVNERKYSGKLKDGRLHIVLQPGKYKLNLHEE